MSAFPFPSLSLCKACKRFFRERRLVIGLPAPLPATPLHPYHPLTSIIPSTPHPHLGERIQHPWVTRQQEGRVAPADFYCKIFSCKTVFWGKKYCCNEKKN